jgi:hypothetical protein
MVDPARFAALKQARLEIATAEAELVALRQSISDFEALVNRRLGEQLDELSELESEVAGLDAKLRQIREQRLYGEHQMRYADGAPRPEQNPKREYIPNQDVFIEPPAPPVARPVAPIDAKTELKRLYRRLARLYHPDLATDGANRAQRTRQMAIINQAFAAGDLPELQRLWDAEGLEPPRFDIFPPPAQPVEKGELEQLQERLHDLRQQIIRLNSHPNIQLSMEVKLARQKSQDLLGEMSKELKHKIARKKAECDYLRAQISTNTQH